MCISLFSCSYIKNYALFIFVYGVLQGISFGLLYMTALRAAWQYFPSRKGLLSGLILSSNSVGAICWTILSKAVANPRNEKPMESFKKVNNVEYFYLPDQDAVKNVPELLRLLSYIFFGMVAVSVILI